MAQVRRQIAAQVKSNLDKKMVLLAGPRQCGKTTLARQLIKGQRGGYYNWDVDEDRHLIRHNKLNQSVGLWVFDELHKFRRWRNWLKGQYDAHNRTHRILVTGSARLAVFGHGGDSLQGRYFLHHLHPFTLAEALGQQFRTTSRDAIGLPSQVPRGAQEAIGSLMKLGGFPEPFLSGSDTEAARWRLGYGARLVREEIRDLSQIRDLGMVEMLFDRLPAVVGSPLSINSLREDLEVAFETVRHWLVMLENLYGCFRLPPVGAPRVKAVKKEQKLYLWDWSDIDDEAARFENLVAFHLLRFCHWCRDVEGRNVELRYFRDRVGHEVDFVLLEKHKPWFVVEAKLAEQDLDKNLRYFLERVPVPTAFQVSRYGTNHWSPAPINGCDIHVLPAATLLANLP